jgi:acetyl esterase/lipase
MHCFAFALVQAPAPVQEDIPYVENGHSLQKLDLLMPSGPGRKPVLIWIHGGGWQSGSRKAYGAKSKWALDKGWAFASIGYRLSPEVAHPAHIQDCAAAVAYLQKNAERLGLDAGRFMVIGHSAGAHLAGLLAADERWLGAHGLQLSILRAAMLLDSAAYDMEAQARQSLRRGEDNIYIQAFGSEPEGWRDASPFAQCEERRAYPPMWMGVADSRFKLPGVNRFAERIRSHGGYADIADATSWKTHATINRDFGRPGDAVTADAERFLEAVLKGGAKGGELRVIQAGTDPISSAPRQPCLSSSMLTEVEFPFLHTKELVQEQQ